MSFHVGQGDTYDISALMPFPRKITTIEKFLLRLSVPFLIPKVILSLLFTKQDLNPLHDGKRQLSGRKLCATSSDMPFPKIKAASKTLKITINDMITACLGSAVKEYMELKGDSKTQSINIAIPANIRFQHY